MFKQFKFAFAVGIAAGMLGASGTASATSCAIVQSCAASPACANSIVVPGVTQLMAYQQNHPECFGSAGSTAGASQMISGTSLQQMQAISNALGGRSSSLQGPQGAKADSGLRSGIAAGGMGDKLNVWGSLSGDNNKYTGSGFIPLADVPNVHSINSSLNVTNVVLGADYLIAPTVALGLSVAFDRGNGSTESFKNGVSNDGVKSISTKGTNYAPYLGWQINQDWALDASMGWGDSDLSSSAVTGSAQRFFYGSNLNYTHWYGNWQVSGKGGYLYGEEKFGNLTGASGTMINTATKNKVDQWRLGAQAGYWMNGVMPYFGLAYSTDSRSTSADAATQQATADLGKSAWLFSLGLNFISLKNGMTGGLVYNQETGRDHGKRDSLMANINVRF